MKRDIVNVLHKIVERYNELRSPESKATILEIDENRIKIKFEGFFCLTCGVNDWIEDLSYIAEDFGISLKLEKVIEPTDLEENYRIGIFSIADKKV